MTNNFVIEYEEIKEIDFRQASIYLDACFILSYLDSDDIRGDKVAEIFSKWEQDGVKCIAISNMVVTEVIHNLFKNHIRNVLTIANSVIKNPTYPLSHKDLYEIGNIETAKRLHSLVPKKRIEKLVQTGELIYPIEQLMKDFKLQFPQHRDYLKHYYKNSVQIYSTFEEQIGFRIITPYSDETTQHHALNHFKYFQLGPADAIHLALTTQHEINYFATLDSDFVHTYYTEESIGIVRILKVA
ncbi:hypothetical protein [Radiobacillus sp. PE A8.2]|uniref:hypothetical protein n=1 Tax=Radiobacillus sp. PE A8.2 TaxID=3380349 RepID=UPI003890F529